MAKRKFPAAPHGRPGANGGGRKAKPRFPTARKPTILLVDDHEGSLHLHRLEVNEWPLDGRCEVDGVAGGRLAVAAIEKAFSEKRPLFVLCDLRMADLGGLEVLQAVAGKSTAPFRFVLTTAGEHLGLEQKAFAAGADDFVLMQNRPGALWEALEGRVTRWLRACESQAAESAAATRAQKT